MVKTYRLVIVALFLGLFACQTKHVSFTESDIQIIPKPAEVTLQEGGFAFSESTQFVVSDETQKVISEALLAKFQKAAGWTPSVTNSAPSKNYVQFITANELAEEAYKLEVTSNHINISASANAGFIYGLETVRQLLPVAIESPEVVSNIDWVIPNVLIQDQPRFKWRGLMLDLSRHFFGKEYLKKTIDRLAMHKMNVLHLHLVDDQGWRIEIKKYPKLTEVGAWRVDQEHLAWNARLATKPGEKGTYGGFLTQEELKELVAYAKTKNVEIVPEIEMPAHVTSAIASYPEYSCLEKPVGVPSGGLWPITDIYCAGKDSTFEFLQDILTEVMAIFPSKYIHIGGDEATKTNWKTCPHCQKRMKTEGLHDVEALQSYFVKRMEKFINAHGKKLIGWDEILEGGLAPDATVMSWRGVKGGVEAAKQGHDVVMTPGTHCYFDHYQGPQSYEPLAWGGFTPLSKVYTFDPVVDTMTPEEAKHVLGGQANLWAEFIPTEAQSEYMIYPRLAALSETVWSPKELRNWEDFSSRISTMFKRYKQLGINYAKSAYLVTSEAKVNIEEKVVDVVLKNEFPSADIRYTIDGSEVNASSEKYMKPIKLTKTTRIRASLFDEEQPVGKAFDETIKFHKAVGKRVEYKEKYSDSYQGAGAFGMVNALRGSKNFHDGQWQAWIGKDMEVTIDLENEETIHQVTVGTLENQGPGIYFPIAVEVYVSNDGKTFEKTGQIERRYAENSKSELKEFTVSFTERKARYVKVKAINLKRAPNGGGTWLFVDEIIVD
ncbi:family 20 glycosylhydrolase [Snuella sp. CAU 1569]|uniref:beta-N-acetylhexosaminidase n=2 Tax=Snuella sedimenti TaxID=2798802 RepID=A0A8J7J0Q3_9FLAO|nr:family 20 glycosylhydrolase [Snuella sedimenti]